MASREPERGDPLFIRTMSRVMESIAEASVHYLKPEHPRSAKGLAARVYEQMRRDFMIAAPFVLHAEFPPLLAAVWALLRETLMVGHAPRGQKETVAWAVSMVNECPFCVDAHYAAVRAAHAHHPGVQDWARKTAHRSSAASGVPPFDPAVAAEYYGTVVAFNYINRLVSVFLGDAMMPTPEFMAPITNRMSVTMMSAMIVKRNVPGEGVALVPPHIDMLAWTPAWAGGHPHIEQTLAAWSATVEGVAVLHMEPAVRSLAGQVIDRWSGDKAPVDDAWLDRICRQLPPRHHPALRLALLTALAPYRVEPHVVNALLEVDSSRTRLLTLVAWAAMRASRRVGEWLMPVH